MVRPRRIVAFGRWGRCSTRGRSDERAQALEPSMLSFRIETQRGQPFEARRLVRFARARERFLTGAQLRSDVGVFKLHRTRLDERLAREQEGAARQHVGAGDQYVTGCDGTAHGPERRLFP